MPAHRAVYRVAMLAVLWPAAAWGQTVAAGDSLLAAGDTTGAITAYEGAVSKDLHNAEAHYRAGLLYMTRHVPGSRLSPPRQKAEEHFRYAIRFAPDSAKYLLALADAFRGETDVTARIQVSGLLEKASALARLHPSAETANIELKLARYRWERYEQGAHHYLFRGQALTLDRNLAYDNWTYVQTFLEQEVRPDPGDFGGPVRDAAEDNLRTALAADPRSVSAAGLLVVLMGEQERWAEAVDVGRHLVRAAPDSGTGWAVYGLALTRANRWAEAERAFNTALARMTPAERAPYENLEVLLKTDDKPNYASLGPRQRAEMDSLYWAVAQPLFLTNRNEKRTEFFARMTYVQHRWGDALRGYAGYESDRGSVYLRYGPPDVWASLGRRDAATDPDEVEGESAVVLWVYRSTKLRFVFDVTPGYARAVFAGDFRNFYRQAENVVPVRYDNVAAVRELDSVDVQTAQFLGDSGKTDVAVFSFAPIGRMAAEAPHMQMQLQTAAIVKDGRMHDVMRERQDSRFMGGDTVQVERRSWRLGLKPDEYLLRVEALIPAVQHGARGAMPLTVRSFAGTALMMSDVVLARNIAPRDSSASRWTDFFIDPSSGRLESAQSVGLLWEIYNLTPDSTGVARYHVELRVTVKEIERHGFTAQILGALGDAAGLSAKGDDAASLGYNRQVAITPGSPQVEFLTLNLTNAPNATYDVEVQVTDRTTGHVVSSLRHLNVTPTPLGK